MSHDIQCIRKGSSRILLRSSMSKVSCLKIHNLTLSTIKSCLPNWSTMVSVTWLCSGFKATFLPPEICPIQSSLLANANHQCVSLKVRFDLPNASELTDPLLFADDTSIFYSHSNQNCLESVLKDELQNIGVWLKCNKLSVNIKKTNYVIFKPRQKKFNSGISLSFGGKPLQQSNITKFLGVDIYDHLTWKYHINYICKQIAKSIGIMFRSRFFLSSTTKLTLYYNLIYPYIVCCSCAWSSTYVSNLNRIYY